MQRLDLDRRTGVALLAQIVEPAPRAFHALKFRRVHHRAQLRGNEPVEFGNARVDRGRQIVGDHHRAVEHLAHEFADQVFRARMLGIGLRHAAFLDDLVEQRGFRTALRGSELGCRRLLVHLTPRAYSPCLS